MDVEDICCATNLSNEDGQQLTTILQAVIANHGSDIEALFNRFSAIVSRYQEQPQLLDPILEPLVTPLANLLQTTIPDTLEIDVYEYKRLCSISRFLWQLSSVRGYKTVVRFMPNEVAAFEPAVRLLQISTNAPKLGLNQSNGLGEQGQGEWEARYVALMWLSMLALVPFDLALVDSSLSTPAAGDGPLGNPSTGTHAPSYPPVVGVVLGVCKEQLSSPAATREAAAVLIGRLVTRPDMVSLLNEFVEWGCGSLRSEGHQAQFALPGITLAFSTAFKLGSRDSLLPAALKVLPAAVELLHSPAASGNALIRKLSVKLIQRATLIFLPRKVASWRYQRGQRTLTAGTSTTTDTTSAGIAGDHAAIYRDEDEYGAWQGDESLAEAVETSIGELLFSLYDRDTVVRWSAAKGIGRVVERLPRGLGDEVVGAVLESFSSPTASDAAWHGGCLAVAELARRGLLLPERLPDAVPLVTQALAYDIRRGPCSVGAHVRDAGAYVCWAFARAYSKEALGVAVERLAPALITLACYDREVNCRRAAAAAFQECVGRLGGFPYGIEIITAADYFTVSVRNTAYLAVAPKVATYPGYLEPLMWHLLRVKLDHWEKATREVTAKAAAALVPLSPALFAREVMGHLLPRCCSPTLETRHGAVAALAELLPALNEAGVWLSDEKLAEVANVLPAIHAKKLSKGKGGEVMRSALCRLAETSAATCVPLSAEQKLSMHNTIMDNLQHSSPEVQHAAAQALAEYCNAYLRSGSSEPSRSDCIALVDLLLHELSSAPVATTRRGAALGLGMLPGWLVSLDIWRTSDALCAAALVATGDGAIPGGDARDAETRVNAVHALSRVVTKTWPDGSSLSQADLARVRDGVLVTLLAALEDYTTDNRGDVGSWVREASMTSLTGILTFLSSPSGTLPPLILSTTELIMHALVKQSVERIGRVREVAGTQLATLAPLAAAAGVSSADQVAKTISACSLEDFSTTAALPVVAQLLRYGSLCPALVEGLAFSVGGLDAQLSEAAGDAIAGAISDLSSPVESSVVAEALLVVWAKHARSGRMCTPLLLLADVLMSRTPVGELQPPQSTFPERLLAVVKSEVVGCTDIPRLRAATGVLCQLAGNVQGELKEEAVMAVLALLGNKYPKVRRYTAELLYTMLLGCDPDDVPAWDLDAVMELLESTAWDGPAEVVRPARMQVYVFLGLQPPVKPSPSSSSGGQTLEGGAGGQGLSQDAEAVARGADDNASYGALVGRQIRGF